MKRTLHWMLFCFLALALTASMVFTGCKPEEKSDAKDITQFKIEGVTETILLDEIYLSVPDRIIVDGIIPDIKHTGVAIRPPLNTVVYLDPVNDGYLKEFVVIAEDGSSKTYKLTVSRVTWATMELQMVPNGNGSIDIWLSDYTSTLPGKEPAGVDIGTGANQVNPAEYDFVLSRRLFNLTTAAADDLFNNNLPNTLLISLAAPINTDYYDYIYDSIAWYVNDQPYNGAPSTVYPGKGNWVNKNLVWLEADDYDYFKTHYITIIARKDEVEYSKTLTFTVVR